MKKNNAVIAVAATCIIIFVSALIFSQPAVEHDPNIRVENNGYNVSFPPYIDGFGGLIIERGDYRLEFQAVNASITDFTLRAPNDTAGVVYFENVTHHVGALNNSSLLNETGTMVYSNAFGLDNNFTTDFEPYRFRLGYAAEEIPPTVNYELFSITYRLEYSEELYVSYRDYYDYEMHNFTGAEALAFSLQFRNSTGELVFLLPRLSITDAAGEQFEYGYYYLKEDGEGLLVEAMYYTGFMPELPYELNLDVTWNTVRIEDADGEIIDSIVQGEDAYLRAIGGFTGKAGEVHLVGPDGEVLHVRYIEDASEEVVTLGLSGNFQPGNYTIQLRELTYPGNPGRYLANSSVELLYRMLANVTISDLNGVECNSFVQGDPVMIKYNTSLSSLLGFILVYDPSGDAVQRFDINGAQDGSFVFQTSETGPWGFYTARIFDARPDFFGEGAIVEHAMNSANFYVEPLIRESHARVEGGLTFTQGDTITISYDYYMDMRLVETPFPTARLLRPDGSLARDWHLAENTGELTYYTDRGTPTGEYTIQVLFINSTGEYLQASSIFEVFENTSATPPPPEIPDWGMLNPETFDMQVAVVLVDGSKTLHESDMSEITDTLKVVRQYYLEASYGHLNVDIADVDFLRGGEWYTLPLPVANYAGSGDLGRENAYRLAEDALTGLWGENLAAYDLIIIVHSGQDQAVTLNDTDVISRALTQSGTPAGKLNVVILSESDPFGVRVHEIGHSLGCLNDVGDDMCQIPDLYPYEKDIGRWGVMGGLDSVFGNGSAGVNGPPHPSSWTKMVLGWLEPFFIERSQPGLYTINALETSLFGGAVLVFDASDPNDEYNSTFYIVEARTVDASFTEFEGTLRETGEEWLVIYRVDVDSVYATSGNERGLLSHRVSIQVLDDGGTGDAVLTTDAGDDYYLDNTTGASFMLTGILHDGDAVFMTVEIGLQPPTAT